MRKKILIAASLLIGNVFAAEPPAFNQNSDFEHLEDVRANNPVPPLEAPVTVDAARGPLDSDSSDSSDSSEDANREPDPALKLEQPLKSEFVAGVPGLHTDRRPLDLDSDSSEDDDWDVPGSPPGPEYDDWDVPSSPPGGLKRASTQRDIYNFFNRRFAEMGMDCRLDWDLD